MQLIDDGMSQPTAQSSLLSQVLAHRHKLAASFIGQGLALAGAVVGGRLLTTFTSPASLGEYNLVLGLTSLVDGILIARFTQFAMRERHDAVANDRIAQFDNYAVSTLWRLCFLSILTLIGAHFIRRFIGGIESIPAILASIAYLIGFAFVNYRSAIFTTSGKTMAAAGISAGMRWVVPIACCIAASLHDSGSSMVTGASVAVVAVAIALAGFSPSAPGPTATTQDRVIWNRAAVHFALPMLTVGVCSWVVNIGDRYLIEYYKGRSEVGVYAAAYGLASMPITACWGAVSQVLYPVVYKASAQKRHDVQLRVFVLTLICALIFGAAAVAFFTAFRIPITNLLIGRAFRDGAADLIPWIAGGYGILVMAMTCDLLSLSIKRTRWMSIAYLVAAVVNVSLNLWLIPRQGGLGAAKATCFTFVIYFLVMLSFALHYLFHQHRNGAPAPEVELT